MKFSGISRFIFSNDAEDTSVKELRGNFYVFWSRKEMNSIY